VHNVSQWPNPRHLGEPLGGAEGLLDDTEGPLCTLVSKILVFPEFT